MNLASKTILVTGGTGSFGKAFINYLLVSDTKISSIIVFSRDEQKQYEMAQDLSKYAHLVKYRLGDVRDRECITEAARNVDVIVHSAAMKHVPAAEHNPIECIKTNILGSQNLIYAAQANRVPKVVVLSTDKAALPSNLYGASKLCMEKLFVSADASGDTRFTIVRYANVFGSKGSVVPLFLKLKHQGAEYLPITDPRMTRFSITMQEGINLVLFGLREGWGGEVIVPKAPSYRILEVAKAIAPELEHRVVGIRPGEKLHEIMYSDVDAPFTVNRSAYYVICPQIGRYNSSDYAKAIGGKPVGSSSHYSSEENDHWLSIRDIHEFLDSPKFLYDRTLDGARKLLGGSRSNEI